MKYFIARLFASVSSVQFYHQVLKEPFKKPVGFYVQVLLLITIIHSVQFWVVTMPFLRLQFNSIKDEIIAGYPEDLIMSWNGNKLESSYNLTIPFPKATPVSIRELADNLAYLNTEETISDQSVLFILTPTNLHLIDQGTIVRSEALATLFGENTFVITHESVPNLSQEVLTLWEENVAVAQYFYPLGLYLVLLITRTYIIFLESGIIFLFLKISRINFSYKQLLQLVVALFIPAEIINLIANLSGINIGMSVISLSFWIFFIYVFFSIRKQ